MGKSLSELDLKDEEFPAVAFDDMPEFGTWAPPPQPGVGYKFSLPADLTSVFDTFEDGGKTFVKVEIPLTILASPGNKENGTSYTVRMTNKRRGRGKDKAIEVSDLDYLLKATTGLTSTPASNKAYVEAVMAIGGKSFTGDVTWSWTCSDQRDIYVQDPADPEKTVKSEGIKGCGSKYYQDTRTTKPEQKIGKLADGTYPLNIKCRCNAVVRAFSNVENVRA